MAAALKNMTDQCQRIQTFRHLFQPQFRAVTASDNPLHDIHKCGLAGLRRSGQHQECLGNVHTEQTLPEIELKALHIVRLHAGTKQFFEA